VGFFDLREGTSTILRLIILDAAVLSGLIWLIVHDVVPLYITTLITYPLLFVVNFVVIWRAYGRRQAPRKRTKLGRLIWLPVIVFTASGAMTVVSWARSPDVRSSVQAIIGTLLAGWMWFLVAYHSRTGRES